MKILKIVFFNLLTFAILLIVINWGCGVYLKKFETKVDRENLPNYEDHQYAREIFKDYYKVQHEYEPFVGWKSKAYEGKTLTISQDGERIHKTDDGKNKNKKVVRFFGGSTMWGEGSDNDNTIPALFNNKYPEYQVYNHGQLAYNTRQELDALISLYSKKEKSDVVIFYDGVNDAAFLCPKEITELPAHRMVPMYREKIYTSKSKVIKGLLADLFYSNIQKLIYKKKTEGDKQYSPYDCISNPAKAERIAEIMLNNWELAHEIVTSHGGKFIAILQPAAFVGKPRTDHLELDSDLGQNFTAVYHQLKSKIAERNHDWIYDLSDRFDGQEYIFIDFCHVSPNGNKIISEEIANILNVTNLKDGKISIVYP